MGDINGESVARKRKLLEDEGVGFDDEGKLLDGGCLLESIPD
jgi:hypothetical protein